MNIFWNNGERETIQGLDILALRQLDQQIEQDWVANVTTISIRARYLSLLPWLFTEFYSWQLLSDSGQATFNLERFKLAAARMEIIVLAATRYGKKWGESGTTYGGIGPELYHEDITALEQDGSIDLEPAGRGGAVYGTYVMPCRGFGLLDFTVGGQAAPVSVTRRGQELHKARRKVLSPTGLTRLVLEGGTLTTDLLEQEGVHFSLNGLHANQEEMELLKEALVKPYVDHAEINLRYAHFTDSARWFMSILSDTSSGMNSEEILKLNYRKLVSADSKPDKVELGWGEYELRRRVHFALELLLGAMTHTVIDLVEATVEQVLSLWETEWDKPPLLDKLLPLAAYPFTLSLQEVADKVPLDVFLDKGPNMSAARDLSSGQKALYALTVLIACKEQTESLRTTGLLPDRHHYLERAFSIISRGSQSVSDTLRELLIAAVIEPHLKTSLRKLGQGQKCSLRFFPEGNILRPTGKRVVASSSGDRLGNVLGFFADTGYLHRIESSRFSLAPDGSSLLNTLGASA